MVLSASTIAITHQAYKRCIDFNSSSAPTLGPQAPFSPSPKPFLNASFYHPTPNTVPPTHLSFPKLLPFSDTELHPPPPSSDPHSKLLSNLPSSHFLHYPPSFSPFPLHKANPLSPSQKRSTTPFRPSHSCVLQYLNYVI
jgi:hypothetical protein